MRRLILAALLLLTPALPLVGCGGPNPAVDEPLVRRAPSLSRPVTLAPRANARSLTSSSDPWSVTRNAC